MSTELSRHCPVCGHDRLIAALALGWPYDGKTCTVCGWVEPPPDDEVADARSTP